MSAIRIYVANLRAYNDGELKGEWFTLPIDDIEEVYEAIFDKDELDEKGNPLHDWAIHDYESPFHIDEHASIEKLSNVAEELELADNYKEVIVDESYCIADVISFAKSLGQDHHVDQFVPESHLVNDLISDLKEGSIYSVKNKLEGISFSSVFVSIQDEETYYNLEGDGNYTTVTSDDLSNALTATLNDFYVNYQ